MGIKKKYIKLENYIDSFLHSDYYLILMAALTLIGWTFDLEFCVGIMLSMNIVMFCVSKDTTPFMAFLWFFIFAGRRSFYGLDYSGYRIVFIILLCIAVLINIIRFKPDFKYALSFGSVRSTTLSLFLLIIPMSIGGLMYPIRNINASIVASVFFIGIAVVYAYCIAMSKKHIIDKDNVMKFMIKLMFLLAIVISSQIVIHLITNGKTIEGMTELLRQYDLYLYWGGSNHIGAMLALCISANFYFIIKYKRTGFLFLIIIIFEFCLMIMTRSRGSILFTTIALPILLIYSIIRAEKKLPLIITAVIIISLTAIVVFKSNNPILYMIEKMTKQGFDDNGRFELWQHGWDLFKRYPIFGAGWDYDVPYPDYGISPMGFHAMIIQVLACSGIIGAIFFTYYYWARYTTFLKRWTDETVIILAGMLILEAYGMIDPISFLPISYFIMLIVMAYSVDQAMPNTKFKLFNRLFSKEAIITEFDQKP